MPDFAATATVAVCEMPTALVTMVVVTEEGEATRRELLRSVVVLVEVSSDKLMDGEKSLVLTDFQAACEEVAIS